MKKSLVYTDICIVCEQGLALAKAQCVGGNGCDVRIIFSMTVLMLMANGAYSKDISV